ncbi:hypothetical protein V501_05763 [Pseudogymnoascus sp. VKM F-4519 (FW-2642)]|nr:hypothetical protein V501_05763 [Pseudogymnoascus sp. VKM F-4519 (FW-2642)]
MGFLLFSPPRLRGHGDNEQSQDKNWNKQTYLYDQDDDAVPQEGDERVASKALLSPPFTQTITSSRSPDQVTAATKAI